MPNTRAKIGPALEVARRQFEDDKVELTDPADWIRRARESGKRPVARRTQRANHIGLVNRVAGPDVERLWRDGLTAPKQFNAAILALAIELRRQDTPKEVANEKLCDWIYDHHNGKSRTYSRSPALANAEIGRVIATVYKRHVRRTWAPLRGLSGFEFADVVRRLEGDLAIADPKTAELLKRYRVERVAFELKRKAKQWIETMGQAQYDRLRQELPDLDPESPEFIQEVLSRCAPFWPDSTQPEFVVPVPYAMRANLDFISERAVWAPWRAVTTAGVFRSNRRASAWDQRAATYRVTLDFGTYDGEQYDDVAVALGTVFSADDVRARYSRHYAAHIRVAIASHLPRIGAAPATGFVRLVRRVLGGSGCHNAVSSPGA